MSFSWHKDDDNKSFLALFRWKKSNKNQKIIKLKIKTNRKREYFIKKN